MLVSRRYANVGAGTLLRATWPRGTRPIECRPIESGLVVELVHEASSADQFARALVDLLREVGHVEHQVHRMRECLCLARDAEDRLHEIDPVLIELVVLAAHPRVRLVEGRRLLGHSPRHRMNTASDFLLCSHGRVRRWYV